MAEKKSAGQLLEEKLLKESKHAELVFTSKELKESESFSEGYKAFLNAAKTEREAVVVVIEKLEKAGYKEFDPKKKYKAGDKIYRNNRGKALIFAVVGKESLDKGVRILASHIDAPKIDLKPEPLYEEGGLALMKTHYYGGIRKYQWVTLPLALHGVVAKKDGSTVNIVIGESEDDPILFISDLLPHLSQDQNKRSLSEGIKGEELNLVIGSTPFKDDKVSQKVKLNVLNILNEKYGITEEDFFSADLTLVPANKAKDVGIDRSMVGSYGHDDRVCAYTSVMASLEVDAPQYTWINVLADREEIGSDGNTGLNSRMLEYFVADLAEPHGVESRTVLSNSKCLSADVTVAEDPTFPGVTDKYNTAKLGYGAAFLKYSGSRGKGGTSEAHAEFLGWLRGVLDNNKVLWQTSTLGKVDQGGGGTVAMFVANLGVDVVDIGAPVISMHAPMEIVSKHDVYSIYRAFTAFLSAE